MKKGGLEIAVLLIGALIIVASLLVKFILNLPPTETLMISNIIFSVGFLIYILYSIMTTNALNKDIRGLNAHIQGLKKEIANKNSEISTLNGTVKDLKGKNAELESQKQELNSRVSELTERLAQIEESNEDS